LAFDARVCFCAAHEVATASRFPVTFLTDIGPQGARVEVVAFAAVGLRNAAGSKSFAGSTHGEIGLTQLVLVAEKSSGARGLAREIVPLAEFEATHGRLAHVAFACASTCAAFEQRVARCPGRNASLAARAIGIESCAIQIVGAFVVSPALFINRLACGASEVVCIAVAGIFTKLQVCTRFTDGCGLAAKGDELTGALEAEERLKTRIKSPAARCVGFCACGTGAADAMKAWAAIPEIGARRASFRQGTADADKIAATAQALAVLFTFDAVLLSRRRLTVAGRFIAATLIGATLVVVLAVFRADIAETAVACAAPCIGVACIAKGPLVLARAGAAVAALALKVGAARGAVFETADTIGNVAAIACAMFVV